jgi:hypothetical protein
MAGIVSSCWNGWMGLALYNTVKRTTKLEKVEGIKQPDSSDYFESYIKEHS